MHIDRVAITLYTIYSSLTHITNNSIQHIPLFRTSTLSSSKIIYRLIKITEKCEIASVEKCIRIICDFYQSSVKKAFREAKKDGLERELELFGMNRQTDKRLKVAVSEWKSNLDANQSEKEVITKHKIGCDLKELAQDQAACSEEDTLAAIRRCKIGRGSSSYADALGETKEETAARRAKELVVEQSKEAKENRALIRRALGGVMG